MTDPTDPKLAEEPIDVLLVEDNPGDVRFIQEAFTGLDITHSLHVVNNGEDALDFLAQRGDFESASVPDLVLLDLNLPKRNGVSVLEEVKTDSPLCRLPVIILTGLAATEDVTACYEHNANAYLTKPSGLEEFTSMVEGLEAFWFSHARLPQMPA